MHTSVIPLTTARGPAGLRLLSCLRVPEIVLLQGSPLLGFVFAARSVSTESARPLALLLAANVCLVAHVFLLNDWFGLSTDLIDPDKAENVFTARGVSRREMAWLTFVLLMLSLGLFSRLGVLPFGLALGVAGLSALYSLPQLNWKGVPLLSSAAHLIGGTLHFLLGYSVVKSIELSGIATAGFFALTFAAGHLMQELRDQEGDARAGIATNAVTFGRRRTFLASLVLFTLAHGVLFVLAWRGALPRALAGLIVLYPLQLAWSLKTLAEGLTRVGICRLQMRYRVLYVAIGLAMVAALEGAWKS